MVNEAKYLVQADAPGQFTIDPAVFVAQVPMQRARQRDPFNSMFNDSFFRDSFFDTTPAKPVRVVSNPVDLTVAAPAGISWRSGVFRTCGGIFPSPAPWTKLR